MGFFQYFSFFSVSKLSAIAFKWVSFYPYDKIIFFSTVISGSKEIAHHRQKQAKMPAAGTAPSYLWIKQHFIE
jgi:hypothetical protein